MRISLRCFCLLLLIVAAVNLSWPLSLALATTSPSDKAVAASSVQVDRYWDSTQRPFRYGVLRLDPQLDRQKPLAMAETAGWATNSGLLIGAFDRRWVGGLSLATGKVAWWLDGSADMTSLPGSFGSSVVFAFRDGKIVKTDALTGTKQWTASVDSHVERPFVLSGTVLYAVTAAQVIYALDFQSGKVLWLYDCGFPEGLTVRGGVKPLVHDGRVLLGLASGEILALTADSGKLVWRYNPAYNDARFHDVVGELVARGGKLALTRYDGLVVSINLGGSVRSVLWQEQLPGIATSLYHNGRYYLGSTNGEVYAYDVDAGRRLFRVVTDQPIMTLAASENTLFAAGAGGRITAINAATGALQWHDAVGGSLASPPVVTRDAIFYATGLKNLYAYRLDGGSKEAP